MTGSEGDALHAVLCAAGFNIRWLLRAIARGGVAAHLFVRFMAALLQLTWGMRDTAARPTTAVALATSQRDRLAAPRDEFCVVDSLHLESVCLNSTIGKFASINATHP